MYVLSDQVIFKALVDAQRAGVELEIILDESSFKNSFGKARALTREGIAFYLFEPNPEEYIKTLMHLKLFLFQAQGLSWHGSYNCSKNAAEKNTELVITSDDPELFQDLVTLFEQLKQHVHVKFIPGIQQD